MANRVTTASLEVLRQESANARVTTAALEVLRREGSTARVTTVAIEVLRAVATALPAGGKALSWARGSVAVSLWADEEPFRQPFRARFAPPVTLARRPVTFTIT